MSDVKEKDALDKILQNIGDFGKLQVSALFWICFVVVVHSATHVAYVFTTYDSVYRCQIPGCDNASTDFEPQWIKNAVPYTSSNTPEKCEMYSQLNETSFHGNCSVSMFDKSHTVKCESYIFKDDENYIGREFNLLCDENLWKLTLVGTLNTVGMFFGLLITGIISDKYGRKFVLLVGMSACGVTGLIKSFSPSYEWFCFFETLEAAFASGTYGCAFILGVELVTPKRRTLTGCISCSCYAIGEVLVAAVAWSVRDWKLIIYILYGPCIFFIFLYSYIPESIRWYLSKGELEKPKKILRKFAEANGKTISEESLDRLKVLIKEQELQEDVTFMDMLRSLPLFMRFLNCSFCWVVCAFLFYGLTLNSVTLSSNSYADFIYISLTEIPAYWIATYVSDKIGRKYSMAGSFTITAVSCFGFLFLSEGSSEWLHIIIYCMGKFGATAAFILIYVIASEVFPTSLRHTTMGISSMIGRLGSVASPQIPLLGHWWKPLPLLMFATLAAIAAASSLFFPETLNIKLPDTIKEAENIGRKPSTESNEVTAS